jgi:hypothetical protein
MNTTFTAAVEADALTLDLTLGFEDANEVLACATLADMSDGRTARNNCYRAAEVASNAMKDRYSYSGMAGLVFHTAEHWAALVVDQEDENFGMVVDYTMRQFAVDSGFPESKIPFPYVGSYQDWKTTVEGWAAARWEETLVDEEFIFSV